MLPDSLSPFLFLFRVYASLNLLKKEVYRYHEMAA